jgi:dipeptidyl aminopeptidase/acylaminoacyl peptidase
MSTVMSRSCLLGLLVLAGTNLQACFAQAGNSPKLFAPGVISGPADDLSPAFTPDGKTVYFTRDNPSGSMIMVSTFAQDRWSAPEIAPFSGKWSDFEPTMAPDGSFLVFASNRPAVAGGKAIDGHFHGKTFPEHGGNLWRVDRDGQGWGEARRLPETINGSTETFSPSISSDGSIYFMQPDNRTGRFHLYRSQFSSGSYLAAVPIGVGDEATEDVDPAVAPDESYLVYSSNRPQQGGPKRLVIVFHQKNGWRTPVDLGDEVNEEGSNIEARLGPDHRTLYFSTNTVPPVSFPRSKEKALRDAAQMQVWANGRQNIWYVSLAPWLEKPRAQQATPITK